MFVIRRKPKTIYKGKEKPIDKNMFQMKKKKVVFSCNFECLSFICSYKCFPFIFDEVTKQT